MQTVCSSNIRLCSILWTLIPWLKIYILIFWLFTALLNICSNIVKTYFIMYTNLQTHTDWHTHIHTWCTHKGEKVVVKSSCNIHATHFHSSVLILWYHTVNYLFMNLKFSLITNYDSLLFQVLST